jgi:hypothetical protein
LAANRIFVRDDIHPIEQDLSRVGVLESGNGAHKSGLARPIGSEQTKHVVANGQAQVIQSLHAVRVALGETANFEWHEATPSEEFFGSKEL